jgi:hypothetical protein
MSVEKPLTPEELERREETANRVFLEPPETQIGNIVLRPISLTSLFQLRQVAFVEPSAESGSDPDALWQMMAFAYIHSGPEKEVAHAAFNRPLFAEKVQAFCATIPAANMPYVLEAILARFDDIKRLEFAVKKKPGDGDSSGPTPPPNS